MDIPTKADASPLVPETRMGDTTGDSGSRPWLCSLRATLGPVTAMRQGFLSLADQGVVSITNFATGVIIARTCSKEEFGLYMLGLTLVLALADMQTSLITTPYMIYAPRLKGHAHALYTGSTLIHQLVLCCIAVLGVSCGAFAVSHGFGYSSLGPVLWALALVVSFIMLREFARRVCFACLKLRTSLLLDTLIAICQISGLLLLAHLKMLSAVHAYFVVGAVCGIAVLVWFWADREFSRPRLAESVADLKKNLILGKWVFASGIVWTVSMNLYPWLLAAFHGIATAAVWAACIGVVSVGNPLILGLQNLLGPKISHAYASHGHKGVRGLVLRVSVVIAIPVSIYCLILIVFGGGLIVRLYGHQYEGNHLVVAILALNLLVATMAFSFSRALFAVERADLDFILNFLALFIMVTVGLLLVRRYGPLGAAIGMLGANVVTSAVRAVAFLRLPRFSPHEQEVG